MKKELLSEVGNTPLVELTNLKKMLGFKGNIYAKYEAKNPTGSIKDRAALGMILDAEEKGILVKGSTIIEPTSGNTGIGLAYFGHKKGYKVLICMPSNMSKERIEIMKKYGAEVILTDASLGMKGAIVKANELRDTTKNSVILGQFDNPANVEAHFLSTGPEIYSSLKGKVDVFVAGVGTGGTITGAGRYLKGQNPNIRVVAVEPLGSPMLSKGEKGRHRIQGIGAGFIPSILDTKIYDEIIPVSNEDAFTYAKLVRKTDNLFVGISSGAALEAAVTLASKDEYKDKNIVVIFPDDGSRYLSIEEFND